MLAVMHSGEALCMQFEPQMSPTYFAGCVLAQTQLPVYGITCPVYSIPHLINIYSCMGCIILLMDTNP